MLCFIVIGIHVKHWCACDPGLTFFFVAALVVSLVTSEAPPPPCPRNEQQFVLTLNAPFTLEFSGQTTGTLQATDTAAVVQTVLEGLSTIGAGNVFVTSTGSNFIVVFQNVLGLQDVPIIGSVGALIFESYPGCGGSTGGSTGTE